MNMAASSVLITGGTGSFGRAMAQTLLNRGCRRVSIYSRDEVKQAEMARVLGDDRARFFIGDVRDRERLETAMDGVDYVFHAAALKRVDACAYNPSEAILTNVVGSMNVRAAAIARKVRRVVVLSTDKACAPSTAYGASKLCMETIFTSSTADANRNATGTAFCVIRYGNVAGSRGSVIPKWRKQLERGEALTVTNADSTRFWFTLKGAVDFALWALGSMEGGELFVPDLKGFSLRTLAGAMAPNAIVRVIEAAPGEKLHESMISADESTGFRAIGRDQTMVFARYLPGCERGIMVPPRFTLSSDTASQMNVKELEEALGDI